MKPQFQHEATTSFALWLDHHLCKNAEAFENKEGNLYYQEDERIPRYPEDENGFIYVASSMSPSFMTFDILSTANRCVCIISTASLYVYEKEGDGGTNSIALLGVG